MTKNPLKWYKIYRTQKYVQKVESDKVKYSSKSTKLTNDKRLSYALHLNEEKIFVLILVL